jgi:hypothetical protein
LILRIEVSNEGCNDKSEWELNGRR